MYGFARSISKIERTFKVLETLGREPGRNKKIDIVRSASSNEILKELISRTYDWRLRYGLKWKEYDGKGSRGLSTVGNYKKFCKITDQLVCDLSGAAAKEKVDNFFKECTSLEKKWYSRILNKSLRVGCGAKSFNVVWDSLIPEFGVQLGIPYSEYLKKYGKIKFPVYAERKLDGVRGLFVKSNVGISSYSRGGLDISEIVKFIVDEMRDATVRQPNGLIDGEFYCIWLKKDKGKYEDQWSKVESLLKRGRKKKGYVVSAKWRKYVRKHLKFVMFDYANDDVFKQSKSFTDSTLIRGRRKHLKAVVAALPKGSRISLVKRYKVYSQKELDKLYRKFLKEGYEGMMIKFLRSPYSITRSSYWIKRKKFVIMDYKIVGVNEGSGRLKGTFGSFTVINKKRETFRVGTGVSDKKRAEFWKQRKSLPGKWIEVRRQKGGTDKKFPSLRIRDDK